jgi:Ca2+-binding RTX toxin-like protein
MLIGGNGRDLLIGGIDADRIVGNADEDLLVAGTTAYDANDAALSSILRDWTSGGSHSSRVANN